MTLENKIAVIGDHDSIIGYKTLGMEVFAVTDATSAAAVLNGVSKDGYVVIYITEQFASQIEDTIALYRSQRLPSVVPIPSIFGKTGIGMQQVKDSVKKAVGADILGFDE